MIVDHVQFDLKNIKKFFISSKDKIQKTFFKKNNGLETCKKISELTDKLVITIYKKVLFENNLPEEKLTLCALGGYGRNHLSPFSDLDILFVTLDSDPKINLVVEKILYILWDLKFKIGHLVGCIDEIIEIAKHDHTIETSILDMRLVCGKETSFKKTERKIIEFFESRKKLQFLNNKINERKKRIFLKNSNAYLLEPNIKENMGGLRDINLVFWFFKRFYLTSNLEKLSKLKIISYSEKNIIKKSLDFFLTIRCYLHYLSSRANERLSFDLQKIISEKMRYKNREPNLRVERLMKHYYLQVRNIKNLVEYLPNELNFQQLEIKKEANLLSTGTALTKESIIIENKNIFLRNSNNFMKIFLDANKFKMKIHPKSLRVLFEESQNIKVNNSCKKIFVEVLTLESSENLFSVINDTGILIKIIPEFAKITAQSQFDLYHVYTVDQHILMALNLVKEIDFKNNERLIFKHPKLVLKSIENKLPLYFSILLHDIGKGSNGDHQKKGADLSKKILNRFEIKPRDKDEIIWLIENHLIFSDFSMNKDLLDILTIKNFVKKIKTIERLKSLYVLTFVDIASVNENSLNDWKALLLKTLYEKSFDQLEKPILYKLNFFQKKNSNKVSLIQKKVFSRILNYSENDFRKFKALTNQDFWMLQSVKDIAQLIVFFFEGSELKNFFNCKIEHGKISGLMEVVIVAYDRPNLLLGVVKKIIKNEFNVLEARIFKLKKNIFVLTFKLSTLSNLNYNHQDLIQKEKNLLKDIMEFSTVAIDLNSTKINTHFSKEILNEEVEILIDNEISANYSVVKVNTNDRPCLLFNILEIFVKHELLLTTAKISTSSNLIEDTFFLKTYDGHKIENNEKLKIIKSELKENILVRR